MRNIRGEVNRMIQCPFCAEEIQDEAIKCRYCGEFLKPLTPARAQAMHLLGLAPPPPPIAWYYKTGFIVAMIACVGPFALPLVWKQPNYSRTAKVWITLGVILLTVALVVAFYYVMLWFLNVLKMTQALLR